MFSEGIKWEHWSEMGYYLFARLVYDLTNSLKTGSTMAAFQRILSIVLQQVLLKTLLDGFFWKNIRKYLYASRKGDFLMAAQGIDVTLWNHNKVKEFLQSQKRQIHLVLRSPVARTKQSFKIDFKKCDTKHFESLGLSLHLVVQVKQGSQAEKLGFNELDEITQVRTGVLFIVALISNMKYVSIHDKL